MRRRVIDPAKTSAEKMSRRSLSRTPAGKPAAELPHSTVPGLKPELTAADKPGLASKIDANSRYRPAEQVVHLFGGGITAKLAPRTPKQAERA